MQSPVVETTIDQVLAAAGRYITVDGYFTRKTEINIRGTASYNPEHWREALAGELKTLGYTLRAYQNETIVHLNIFPEGPKIPWVNILLFIATLTTVSISYAFIALLEGGVSSFKLAIADKQMFLHWQKFAIPLILILLFHEFGHYLAARRRGIRVSLPYFLPAPTIIGTFGAFIKSNSPFPSRRDLLEVGAYGPVAGFVIAVIFLAVGLTEIAYRLAPPGMQSGGLVEPLIMRIMEFFFLPNLPTENMIYLQDNPFVFAAWVGLFVTSLNLLPVGQLDGGHIVYALSPTKHAWISRGIWSLLLGLGFFWQGWWMWAIMIFFIIKFRHPPTLNDAQPLERRSRWLGWTAIAIFLLTFSPAPF